MITWASLSKIYLSNSSSLHMYVQRMPQSQTFSQIRLSDIWLLITCSSHYFSHFISNYNTYPHHLVLFIEGSISACLDISLIWFLPLLSHNSFNAFSLQHFCFFASFFIAATDKNIPANNF